MTGSPSTAGFAESIFAFRRHARDSQIIVLVPRLIRTLGATPVGDLWEDTRLDVPTGRTNGWTCLIHGETHLPTNGAFLLSAIFTALPVAVLVNRPSGDHAPARL